MKFEVWMDDVETGQDESSTYPLPAPIRRSVVLPELETIVTSEVTPARFSGVRFLIVSIFEIHSCRSLRTR
jgi:hypothetical protein